MKIDLLGVVAEGYVEHFTFIYEQYLSVFLLIPFIYTTIEGSYFLSFGLQWVCLFNSRFQGILVENEWCRMVT